MCIRIYYYYNPQAQSNWNKSIPAMYTSHQNEKKTEYGPRAREVEKATLTAAVMSTSGGMGKEMDMLVRQIATKLSVKRGERYSDTVRFFTVTYIGPPLIFRNFNRPSPH